MSIPPYRAPGDIGHIDDHNAIVDVLTGNDTDIAEIESDLNEHINAEDPHGDRAYADAAIEDALEEIGAAPVTSVNTQTGEVVLSAGDVGAETPTGAQNKVDELANTLTPLIAAKLDAALVGEENGVAPLDGDGVIPNEYIPSLTGSNRITVSESEPVEPNDGDIWINPGEVATPPLSGAPTAFKTRYTGPRKIHTDDLPEASAIGNFPDDTFDPIVFTTGPIGFTEVYFVISGSNNTTDNSTALYTYSMMGDGVDEPGGFDKGAYQGPRVADVVTGIKSVGIDTFELPPSTEVTLTPQLRLSSVPLPANQNNDTLTGRIFQIDSGQPCFISVKCW